MYILKGKNIVYKERKITPLWPKLKKILDSVNERHLKNMSCIIPFFSALIHYTLLNCLLFVLLNYGHKEAAQEYRGKYMTLGAGEGYFHVPNFFNIS